MRLLPNAPTPDQFQTSNGTLTVQPILHGTVAVEWNNKTTYVNPYGGAKVFEGIKPPDLVLITDIHGDHLNAETLNAPDLSKSILAVPKAVADQLPENLKSKAAFLTTGRILFNWESQFLLFPYTTYPKQQLQGIPKDAATAISSSLGGKLIYFSGDTEDIPEMRNLKNIDVAFV